MCNRKNIIGTYKILKIFSLFCINSYFAVGNDHNFVHFHFLLGKRHTLRVRYITHHIFELIYKFIRYNDINNSRFLIQKHLFADYLLTGGQMLMSLHAIVECDIFNEYKVISLTIQCDPDFSIYSEKMVDFLENQ